MIRLLAPEEWKDFKREPLQTYKDYSARLRNGIDDFAIASESLSHPPPDSTAAGAMTCARLRGEIGLQFLTYSFSAGLPVTEIAAIFPVVVSAWQEFAHYDQKFDESSESDGHRVPHLDLHDQAYWEALQLVTFAILLGHPGQLQPIMDLLIYENDDQDALLEGLVAPYLPGRPGSTVYTRQLPYRKTKKIFAAKPEQRPALMATYLEEWYDASRREPYHDRHKSSYFPGYWSLEAAAITFVLDIDDSSYRDKRFYPKDLVDYARSVSRPPGSPASVGAEMSAPLHVPAGQLVPSTGWWFTAAKENSGRYFKQGDLFPQIEGSSYGATFWQWAPDQSAPQL